jgi:hypothetical protein
MKNNRKAEGAELPLRFLMKIAKVKAYAINDASQTNYRQHIYNGKYNIPKTT